jgi:carbamoyltransferase
VLILGINEGIESSVVLCEDGRVIFAIQEERLTRERGRIGFPSQSVMHCLKAYQLDARSIDHVCWSNLSSPMSETRDDIMTYYAGRARSWSELALSGDVASALTRLSGRLPASAGDLLAAWQVWRRKTTRNPSVEQLLARCGLDAMKISRFHHHSNHAASAYYGLRRNSVDPHLVFTLDGGGDDACAHLYLARRGQLELLSATPTGHSLGNVYACTTFLMGMRPHDHEYKLMGLAPYADARAAEAVKQKFERYLDLDPGDPFRFRRKVRERTTMLLPRMVHDFRFTRFDDLAAGLQRFTEELLLRWIDSAVKLTGISNVLAAGGVFMNVKANKRIAELPGIQFFDVCPSCGDESLPFGAVWQCHVREAGSHEEIRLDDLFLGPHATDDLSEAKRRYGEVVEFEFVNDPERRTAELLAAGHIVGRCSGRMEFGARALGNRSILADPRSPGVMPRINKTIKKRDFWMPFAPAVISEKAGEYLVVQPSLHPDRLSPFMMHSFDTTASGKELAGAVHPADGTARAQIVSEKTHPAFHALIAHFGRLTGTWALLNTSFNLHGHPMVSGTMDAIEVMLASDLEYVMADHYLIRKRTAANGME